MEVKEPSLKTLIERSEKNEFVLPNFQRDYVWTLEYQKRLLSTFLVNLPTGNFLTLEGKDNDFPARQVCTSNSLTPKSSCFYLLDGQQRFSTLKNAFFNLYGEEPTKWKKTWDILFSNLQYRFYLSLRFNENHDYFGLSNLNFDNDFFNKIEPSMLEEKIVEKKIFIKDEKKPFHPGYNPMEKGVPKPQHKRQFEIAKCLSDELLIPLYEFSNDNKSNLLFQVLKIISTNRIHELTLQIIEENEIIELLKNIEPNIDIYLKENNQTLIDQAWHSLALNWTNSVFAFFKSKLEITMVELQLKRDEVDRAFAVFEVINKPGTPLDEYDLIVARAARDNKLEQLSSRIKNNITEAINLPEALTYKINGIKPKLHYPYKIGALVNNVIAKDLKIRFLQILSIISHCEKKINPETLSIDHLKRSKILSLKTDEINTNFNKSINAILRAYAFLHYRCGVVNIEQIPYKLMVIPISYQFINDTNWKSKKAHDKIEYWYWTSLLGGYYKMDQYSQAKNDVLALNEFIRNNNKTLELRRTKIFEVDDYCNEKIILNQDEIKLNPNIDKAILQYILSNQPFDFLDKKTENRLTTWGAAEETLFEYKGVKETLVLEDHHICPLNSKKKIGESTTAAIRSDKKEILNSPVNRTYISKTSNREISVFTPKEYFEFISESAKHNHCIPSIKSVYVQDSKETDDDYFNRVCKLRFEEIKREINSELLKLIDK